MKVLGLNFTKISAEKSLDFKPAPINTNIEFLNIDKEKVEVLNDMELIKITFKFSITYKESEEKVEPDAEILFEGNLLLSVDKEESKNILKSWKKKEILPQLRLPLFNLILKKCSVKALELEEELSLPHHVPLPTIQPEKKQ